MKEYEIRPKELFDAYLKVAKEDTQRFFGEKESFEEIPCLACEGTDLSPAFVKDGFQYCTCRTCWSLFVNPRPTAETIARFYRESASSKFWAERFFPETAEARRVQIFRPRAETLATLLERFDVPRPWVLADIGAGYGLFLEEAAKVVDFDGIVGIEPSRDLAASCRARGFDIVEKAVEDVDPGELQASVMTSFEVLEHLHQPVQFLKSARRLLMPEGLLIFTTLTISGWDLRVMWQQSKSISPPHHINLISTEGMERLVRRAGLVVEEIVTPGQLDVDIVKNMLEEDPAIELPRFAEYLLNARGEDAWADFQAFLQKHALSSHVRVVARKPKE